jgi:hypothetical protein
MTAQGSLAILPTPFTTCTVCPSLLLCHYCSFDGAARKLGIKPRIGLAKKRANEIENKETFKKHSTINYNKQKRKMDASPVRVCSVLLEVIPRSSFIEAKRHLKNACYITQT